MSNITEYQPSKMAPVPNPEVSSKVAEMVRSNRFLDDKTRKHLMAKQGIFTRLFPTKTDGRIQQFQYEITDICSQFFLEEFRENCNDYLMRMKASLRADTIIYYREQQAKVETNLSQSLRAQASRICDDIAFCNALPDEMVRKDLEEVIRANFHKMLTEFQRTSDYFNESLDIQIKSARALEQ